MPDYIEREALAEKVAAIRLHVSFGRSVGKTIFAEAMNLYRDAVLKAIKEAPAADVAAVHTLREGDHGDEAQKEKA